jgi:hypothetical protein
MTMLLTIQIAIGEDSAEYPRYVAEVARQAANQISARHDLEPADTGLLRDQSGRVVGRWGIEANQSLTPDV